MPRKVGELADLTAAGFSRSLEPERGSQHKFTHERYPGAVKLSCKLGDDAKIYQEKQVSRAIEETQE